MLLLSSISINSIIIFAEPKSTEMQNNNPTNVELAQSIIELTSYPLMVSSLQSLRNESEAKHRDVIEQLKGLLILQPEQIYINHSNLTMDRIKLIRDIFRIENNLDAKYFETTSGYILMAVAQGFLLQNLQPEKMNKLKQIFARKVQRSTNLWGFGQLQNLQAYLIDKSTGYFPSSSPIHHDMEIERFSYFLEFYGSYQYIFPQLTDILSIFFKMMLCLREEREKDRQLMAKIKLKYLENRYHYQTTTKNMKFVLQFFKHSFSEKDCLYYPQKSLQSILSSYSLQEIEHLLHVTSVGVLWQQSQVYEYFLNCIKLGFSEISRKMMVSMIKFCEKSGKFNELLYSYENNIKRIFIFMKFPKFFNPCMEILKYCILSPPTTLSLYQKFLSEAVVFMGKVDSQQKFAFLNLLQIVSYAYKDSTPMEELNKIIADNIDNDVNKLTQEEIKKALEEYSWKQKLNNKNNCVNVITQNKPKSNYKGLTNIGNSCYMNSFLQALFMNRQFLKHIIRSSTLQIRVEKLKDKKYQGKPKEYIEKDIQEAVKPFAELQKTFALLLKSIRNEVSPSNIRLVAPQMFRNSSQHDTIDFGRCFLELIFRNIPAMFEGEVTTQIFCKECSQIRQRKQAFLDYHVSTENGELQELIQSSFKQEIVEGLTCDHCEKKGKESIKHHFISKFPNYLIISINRFEYDVIEKRNKKNKSKIIVNPFIKIAEIEYEIYSIIIHTGPSPNAGHYFTFSKTKYEPNCKWICHNDSQVSQFEDFGQVNSFLENSEEDTPYILFYEKREHIEKMKEQLSQPIVLREPQEKFVKKENETYLSSQKKVKFQLQPINYNFFMKNDDEDEDHRGNGGGGFYNNYIA